MVIFLNTCICPEWLFSVLCLIAKVLVFLMKYVVNLGKESHFSPNFFKIIKTDIRSPLLYLSRTLLRALCVLLHLIITMSYSSCYYYSCYMEKNLRLSNILWLAQSLTARQKWGWDSVPGCKTPIRFYLSCCLRTHSVTSERELSSNLPSWFQQQQNACTTWYSYFGGVQ